MKETVAVTERKFSEKEIFMKEIHLPKLFDNDDDDVDDDNNDKQQQKKKLRFEKMMTTGLIEDFL